MTTSEMSNQRVLYLQFTNPAAYPPLEHSSQILAGLGWQVLFLGTGAFGAKGLRFIDHPNIVVKRMPFPAPGWRQKVAYVAYVLWAIWHVLRWRPAWVYASDLYACPLALLLTYWHDVHILYHEHDAPTSVHPSVFIRWLLWARARTARRADLCVIPSQQRADRFEHELAVQRPPVVVWNCPRRHETESCQSTSDHEAMWVLYNGSIVPGRLPLTVVMAMTKLPAAVRLRIVGYATIGAKDYVDQIKHFAELCGVSDRVELMDAVPRYKLAEIASQCHVGLALLATDSNDLNELTMVGPSNKPFGYLACGLPLLVSDLPDWQETFVENGYGLACDPTDVQSIAAALQWYWDHPDERQKMGRAGRERIRTEWNYETQFAPVLTRIVAHQLKS